MRISIIFGTRPEAIKLAPLILAMKRNPQIECLTCVTGQHSDLLDQALVTFGISVDSNLNLMQNNQSLGGFTSRAMLALDKYLADTAPDWVIVQGDTTTVFCATLSAFYHKIPVAHVEAGLRTGNINSPWPEEANRVLVSRLASLHFAPTKQCQENLLKEGVSSKTIIVTGNTVIDALIWCREIVKNTPPVIAKLPDFLQPGSKGSKLVLVTSHRRENLGDNLKSICLAIKKLSLRFPDTHFVYPVHPNPNVRSTAYDILSSETVENSQGKKNVHLIDPLSYQEMVALMDCSELILTDSGGIQEEAPSLSKPILVLRDTTERPEAVEAGLAELVGTETDQIIDVASRYLSKINQTTINENITNPYGDGLASKRIVESLLRCKP